MIEKDQPIPVSPALEEVTDNEPKRALLSGRVFFLSLQAIFNAILVGVAAKALVMLIALFTNLAFLGRFSFEYSRPSDNHLGWLVIFIPVIGGLIVGLIARFGSPAIRGHGIPEAMENIIVNESKIPPAITFLKPFSAAISIGTGGPFGAEGPIIATGGAFGSLTGQIMRISAAERKIMLAAGACAGMSAIFGSPVGALMLAIELLLFEFSPRSIIPVALSCAAGAVMHILLFGTSAVFSMPAIPEADGSRLIIYLAIGAVTGAVATLVSRAVYGVEDLFEKLPVHWMWWPALGSLAVGMVGFFAPQTMGVGYENITDLLGGTLPFKVLFVLCFLKFISWVISLGSGTSGGTLAPLFTIGGAFGAIIAGLLVRFVPGLHVNVPTIVLISMAAMFAGASRALLTSVIFALETTGQMHAALPLLGACTAAYFVSFFLLKGSIMTEKIQRRGIRTPEEYRPDVLQSVTAGMIMQETSADEEDYSDIQWEGIPAVTEHAVLSDVCARMSEEELDLVAVVANEDRNKVLGVLEPLDILHAYSEEGWRDRSYNRAISIPRRSMKLIIRGRRMIRNRRRDITTPTS